MREPSVCYQLFLLLHLLKLFDFKIYNFRQVMASQAFIISASLVIAAQGSYVWQDDDNEWPGFQPIIMPNIYFPPIPPPPPLPTFDDFYWPPPPLPGYPPFLPFPPMPKIPTPGEIKNIKPKPGQVYSGVAVKSASKFSKNKDGKVIKTGGTTIVTNDNGDVDEITVGDAPPNINDPIKIPPMPEFPEFKPFEFPEFKPIHFEPIKPIDPDEIRNRQPKDNEHYTAFHTSAVSHSSNINGVKSSGGGTHTITNVDGKVDEEAVRVGQHDDE